MPEKSIEMIVDKRLKWHKTEVVMLWLLIAMGAILIPAGIGVCFYVGKLTIVQHFPAISVKNYIMAEIRMVCYFARVLGIIFSAIGVVVMILALDRLSFAKTAYKMASFIKRSEENIKVESDE